MGEGGRIVTISGMDTHRFVAGHGVLAGAKAALETFTRYLAVELGPRGITVNAVNPGYVATDSVELYLGDPESEACVLRGGRGVHAAARGRRGERGGRPGRLPLLDAGGVDAGPGALSRRRRLPARARPRRALVEAHGTIAGVGGARLRPARCGG